ARMARTRASATGLRRTLAIPGRVSSSDEICDPPSSAGIGTAAPRLKVAPSYNAPSGASRIVLRSLGAPEAREGAPRDAQLGLGKQLAQHGARTRIEWHVEVHVEPVLHLVGAPPPSPAGPREPAGRGGGRAYSCVRHGPRGVGGH